ncbi:MAG: peptidylprolyl isomerase [bacterium]
MGKQSQKRREAKEQLYKKHKENLRQIESRMDPFYNFWKKIPFWIVTICLLAVATYPFVSKYLPGNPDQVTGNSAIIHTSMGDISVDLYKKDAPKTTENFAKLAQKGFYSNLTWHRVIKGFMIQGGDPSGNGTGGPGYQFADEINPTSLGLTQDQIDQNVAAGYTYNYNLKSHKAEVGSLAMANSGPNTNGSQFFIVTEQNQPSLDGKYTVFGQVTKGQNIAVAISEVSVDDKDKPVTPVYITSIEVK